MEKLCAFVCVCVSVCAGSNMPLCVCVFRSVHLMYLSMCVSVRCVCVFCVVVCVLTQVLFCVCVYFPPVLLSVCVSVCVHLHLCAFVWVCVRDVEHEWVHRQGSDGQKMREWKSAKERKREREIQRESERERERYRERARKREIQREREERGKEWEISWGRTGCV